MLVINMGCSFGMACTHKLRKLTWMQMMFTWSCVFKLQTSDVFKSTYVTFSMWQIQKVRIWLSISWNVFRFSNETGWHIQNYTIYIYWKHVTQGCKASPHIAAFVSHSIIISQEPEFISARLPKWLWFALTEMHFQPFVVKQYLCHKKTYLWHKTEWYFFANNYPGVGLDGLENIYLGDKFAQFGKGISHY